MHNNMLCAFSSMIIVEDCNLQMQCSFVDMAMGFYFARAKFLKLFYGLMCYGKRYVLMYTYSDAYLSFYDNICLRS